MSSRAESRSGAPVVLVVDDHDDSRDLYVELLTFAGFGVVTAADGEQALILAATPSVRVVLLDLGLPGDLDGWNVAARLKADDATKHLCIVALTGFGGQEAEESARRAGCDHFLTKPCGPAALLEQLRECVGEGTDSGGDRVRSSSS